MHCGTIYEIRHCLHDNPGISGHELYAHDLIVQHLKELSPDHLYDHVGGYGVVALWTAVDGCGETLAFRADTDALPIGHRCGHDGHTAILLRFAEIVAADSHRRNNIMLIFQPEEETGQGAGKIVDSGLLQKHNVQYVFGLHNLPGYPKGCIVLNRHTFAAASIGVIYRLHGRATHASTPEKGINPGMAAAKIITAFHNFNQPMAEVSGQPSELASFRQSTLICCRIGDEAFGTSAGDGVVMFTLRAYTNRSMTQLLSDADAIVDAVAKRHGLAMQRELREPFRATENTPDVVDRVKEILLADGRTLMAEKHTPFRWSEDFAEYLTTFKGAFFGIGSGEQQPELHHPDYDFPDDIIEPAAACFERIMNYWQ